MLISVCGRTVHEGVGVVGFRTRCVWHTAGIHDLRVVHMEHVMIPVLCSDIVQSTNKYKKISFL